LTASRTAARGVKLSARLLNGGRFLPGDSLLANRSPRLHARGLALAPPEGEGLLELTLPAIEGEN
jgi:hypothetical protein